MENIMRAPITDAVMERLDRLERQIRLWRAFGTLSVLVAALLLFMGLGPSGPPVVAAQRFVVVDGHGTPYASFGLAGDGRPMMELNDKNGTTRVMIGVLDGEPEVVLTSDEKTVRWTAR
ncbi:MAG: hypothetical protein HYU41_14845 [Candidatus Rokubacteria bacterium]|nr:hypothetical protein [Candidatus Rokubacteria bacterium]